MKRKLTIYVDPEVARAAKVQAARTDKPDSQVVEEALRGHLGMSALDQAQELSELSERDALDLAYTELRAARRERR